MRWEHYSIFQLPTSDEIFLAKIIKIQVTAENVGHPFYETQRRRNRIASSAALIGFFLHDAIALVAFDSLPDALWLTRGEGAAPGELSAVHSIYKYLSVLTLISVSL